MTADALSYNPHLPTPTEDMADTDVQVAVVTKRYMYDLDVSTDGTRTASSQ